MLAFTQTGLCLLCPLNRAARDESVAVGTLAGGSWRGAGHPAMDRAPSQAPRPSPLHGLARPACRPCLVLQGPAQGRKLSVPGSPGSGAENPMVLWWGPGRECLACRVIGAGGSPRPGGRAASRPSEPRGSPDGFQVLHQDVPRSPQKSQEPACKGLSEPEGSGGGVPGGTRSAFSLGYFTPRCRGDEQSHTSNQVPKSLNLQGRSFRSKHVKQRK